MRAVDRDRYGKWMRGFNHHVIAAFYSIQSKTKLLKRPDYLFAVWRRNGRHLSRAKDSFKCHELGRSEGNFLTIRLHRSEISSDHFGGSV